MVELLSVLQNIINNAMNTNISDTDILIAQYLLDNISPVNKLLDIDMIAEACYTSPSTVSRFCRRFGFVSFGHLKARYLQIDTTSIELLRDNESNLKFNSVDDVQTIENYVELIYDSLKDFREHFEIEEYEALCRKIYEAKEVVLYGSLLSGAMLENFQYLMLGLGKKVHYYPTSNAQLKSIELLTEDSLVLVASVEGNYIHKRNEIVIALSKSSAYKILITQNVMMKEAHAFDQVVQLGHFKHPKVGRYKLQLFLEILVNKYHQLYRK